MSFMQHFLFSIVVPSRRAQNKTAVACLPTKYWARLWLGFGRYMVVIF